MEYTKSLCSCFKLIIFLDMYMRWDKYICVKRCISLVFSVFCIVKCAERNNLETNVCLSLLEKYNGFCDDLVLSKMCTHSCSIYREYFRDLKIMTTKQQSEFKNIGNSNIHRYKCCNFVHQTRVYKRLKKC